MDVGDCAQRQGREGTWVAEGRGGENSGLVRGLEEKRSAVRFERGRRRSCFITDAKRNKRLENVTCG